MFLYSVCGPSCKLTSFKYCNNKLNCKCMVASLFPHDFGIGPQVGKVKAQEISCFLDQPPSSIHPPISYIWPAIALP